MRHITEFILIATCLFVTAQAIPGQNPVPFLDYPLVPSTVPPGGTGFTLTISGAGFPQGAIVNWNGSPRPTTVVSATQVAATISAGDVAQAGTAYATVGAPGGLLSNVQTVSVLNPVLSYTITPA